ncbi:MAG: hypothetical protein L0Z63_03955 [Actinobacteria bacterium]|nr:hypothetical protein [Actinomycetota bacterium]
MERRHSLNAQTRIRLVGAGIAALVLSGLIAATAWKDGTPLGAPHYWAWLLTGFQVMALWSAGRGRRWGWLLGGSVQLPWIVYAVVTTQLGFIPGCAVSAAVQTYSFLRCGRSHMMTAGRVEPRLS